MGPGLEEAREAAKPKKIHIYLDHDAVGRLAAELEITVFWFPPWPTRESDE